MEPPVVAVVLPCLNEEATLRETCRSLGFIEAKGDPLRANTFLFIVDNGSTDSTLEVAREVQQVAPAGSVILGQERERGYIPPRHTGSMLVKAFSERHGLNISEVLILQADADTIYGAGYVEQMRKASQTMGNNFILEGLAEYPAEFQASFPLYIKLCRESDEKVFALLPLPEASAIPCTDAVCGYRLSDYFAWGGHQREYRDDGEEILAETTRLYMRSLTRGAQKHYVTQALACPSGRKIIKSPGEEFASSGFPREGRWRTLWASKHESVDIGDFGRNLDNAGVLDAIYYRERHLVALFGVLPLHVARTLGVNPWLSASPALTDIALSLPERRVDLLAHHPGILLLDALNLVDSHRAVLGEALSSRDHNHRQDIASGSHDTMPLSNK